MALDEALLNEDLVPVLARGRAATPTLAFPAVPFEMKL